MHTLRTGLFVTVCSPYMRIKIREKQNLTKMCFCLLSPQNKLNKKYQQVFVNTTNSFSFLSTLRLSHYSSGKNIPQFSSKNFYRWVKSFKFERRGRNLVDKYGNIFFFLQKNTRSSMMIPSIHFHTRKHPTL